jgi:predicted enzyme related to lactoylglutathione lyase
MIQGVHAMFYSSEADALRDFLRDKLALPFTDVGEGWLIFDAPSGDVGAHPTGHPGSPPSGTHNVSFFCDDIEATVAELRARGVEFTDAVSDQGYGLVIHFTMPGGVQVELYQPRYEKRAPAAAKKRASPRPSKPPRSQRRAAKPARSARRRKPRR